jgi:NAD(P)-dependent dehydrogenase (short-subunit alcohol dehydrogenase family)
MVAEVKCRSLCGKTSYQSNLLRFNAKKAGYFFYTALSYGISRLQYSCECCSCSSKYYSYITAFFAEKKKPKSTEGFNDFHPIGKFGSADEVANAIVFLLSDKSSWTTGAIIDVEWCYGWKKLIY